MHTMSTSEKSKKKFFSCTIIHKTCSIIHRLNNVSGNTLNQNYFIHEAYVIDSPVAYFQINFLKAPNVENFENLPLQQKLMSTNFSACRGVFRNICFCQWDGPPRCIYSVGCKVMLEN